MAGGNFTQSRRQPRADNWGLSGREEGQARSKVSAQAAGLWRIRAAYCKKKIKSLNQAREQPTKEKYKQGLGFWVALSPDKALCVCLSWCQVSRLGEKPNQPFTGYKSAHQSTAVFKYYWKTKNWENYVLLHIGPS